MELIDCSPPHPGSPPHRFRPLHGQRQATAHNGQGRGTGGPVPAGPLEAASGALERLCSERAVEPVVAVKAPVATSVLFAESTEASVYSTRGSTRVAAWASWPPLSTTALTPGVASLPARAGTTRSIDCCARCHRQLSLEPTGLVAWLARPGGLLAGHSWHGRRLRASCRWTPHAGLTGAPISRVSSPQGVGPGDGLTAEGAGQKQC